MIKLQILSKKGSIYLISPFILGRTLEKFVKTHFSVKEKNGANINYFIKSILEFNLDIYKLFLIDSNRMFNTKYY